MSLPRELSDAVTSASLALSESPNGHLPIRARRSLWDAMGPYKFDDEEFAYGSGHLRRATLACAAAEAAYGVWRNAGGDTEPDDVLQLVESYLSGYVKSEVAWDAGLHLADRADYLDEGVEAWVILATFHAVNVAFSDELTFGDGEQSTEDLLSDYDAGYYAACAISGGHPDDPESSVSRRRRFWDWYLESAIPAAYQVGLSRAAQ